jgi:hypothetical protein
MMPTLIREKNLGKGFEAREKGNWQALNTYRKGK